MYVISYKYKKQGSFRFVGTREVNVVIKGLKNNKSICVDETSMRVLKDAMVILLVEITQPINECLDRSIMPTQWKVGMVTPTLNIGDYRPISVLPAPTKIIERLVYNQLVYYLECYLLLDRRQHALS